MIFLAINSVCARVIARARVFLDEAFPIAGTSHADVRRYAVKDGQLLVDDLPLVQPQKFVGYRGNPKAPDAILLRNNGLHVELIFDRAHFIGSRDQALLADVQLESALTAIMDCEDSVACVDAKDKVTAYRNWLGLMRGTLSEAFPDPPARKFANRPSYLMGTSGLPPEQTACAPRGRVPDPRKGIDAHRYSPTPRRRIREMPKWQAPQSVTVCRASPPSTG